MTLYIHAKNSLRLVDGLHDSSVLGCVLWICRWHGHRGGRPPRTGTILAPLRTLAFVRGCQPGARNHRACEAPEQPPVFLWLFLLDKRSLKDFPRGMSTISAEG